MFTSKIVWDQPPGQLRQQSVCITKVFLHKLSETISGKLICMLVVLIVVSTWQQVIVLTELSGQMLTFKGAWGWRRGVLFTDESWFSLFRADGVCGVVWLSGLLMSTLWIEWPMVAVGLWYGQVYVMENEHRCILLMAFWLHRDTVTRSWGPLLCHSSTTITSCCSMIMHGPMLQGSVHNSWKLKTSQFLHGQHTHRRCHPFSIFWTQHVSDTYTTVCSSSCQYPATSHSHWRGVDQQATINNLINSIWRRCEANGGHTRYWLVVWPPNKAKLHISQWPFIMASLLATICLLLHYNKSILSLCVLEASCFHITFVFAEYWTRISYQTIFYVTNHTPGPAFLKSDSLPGHPTLHLFLILPCLSFSSSLPISRVKKDVSGFSTMISLNRVWTEEE